MNLIALILSNFHFIYFFFDFEPERATVFVIIKNLMHHEKKK